MLLVFGGVDGQAFAPTSVYRRARAGWKKLTPITLHESRHSCISMWIAAGVNPKTVSEYTGHASIVVTFDRYGHLLRMPRRGPGPHRRVRVWCH